jgi:hypothetical protein
MTTSRRTVRRSRRGEAEFWKSWRQKVSLNDLVERYAIPTELQEKLAELLSDARTTFIATDEEQMVAGSESAKRAKVLRSAIIKRLRGIDKLWKKAKASEPDAAGLVNWDASMIPIVARGSPAPELDELPDYVGLFLARTISAFEECEFHYVPLLRADSTRSWREALEGVVAYYKRS